MMPKSETAMRLCSLQENSRMALQRSVRADNAYLEYGGWIRRRTDCSTTEPFFYDDPTHGSSGNVNVGPPPKDDAKVWYHVHRKLRWYEFWLSGENFSAEDAQFNERWDSTAYLGTPTMHIKKLLPGPAYGYMTRQVTIR